MSNCDFVAGRSLIDLLASRLALRAPALRAATALTRPNQSAQWLPCGRHTVPTGKMVGPNNVVTGNIAIGGGTGTMKGTGFPAEAQTIVNASGLEPDYAGLTP